MWATADDVRLAAGIDDDSLTDTQIESYIDQAYSLIMGELGGNFSETRNIKQKASGDLQRIIRLYQKPIISVDGVYKNEELLTESTDYTINLTTGVLTLDSSLDLAENDEIYILYSPQILKTWEIKLAAYMIQSTGQYSTASSNIKIGMEERQKELDKIRDIVLSTPQILLAYDDEQRDYEQY